MKASELRVKSAEELEQEFVARRIGAVGDGEPLLKAGVPIGGQRVLHPVLVSGTRCVRDDQAIGG